MSVRGYFLIFTVALSLLVLLSTVYNLGNQSKHHFPSSWGKNFNRSAVAWIQDNSLFYSIHEDNRHSGDRAVNPSTQLSKKLSDLKNMFASNYVSAIFFVHSSLPIPKKLSELKVWQQRFPKKDAIVGKVDGKTSAIVLRNSVWSRRVLNMASAVLECSGGGLICLKSSCFKNTIMNKKFMEHSLFLDRNIDSLSQAGIPHKKVIIITGVAGYIGSHAALRLLELGHVVVGIDNLSRGSSKALRVLQQFEAFYFHKIDLGDIGSVTSVLKRYKNAKTVFHFAAIAFTGESVEFPGLYRANITRNTQILVDAMVKNGIKELVYSSTCAVYGSPTTFPITEATVTNPISPYGVSKLEAEKYIKKRASDGTLRAHILRYFNVVGAEERGRLGENPRPELAKYGRLWTAVTSVLKQRQKCVILHDSTLDTPDGTAIRDYIHVSDLVEAHLAVVKYGFINDVDIWNVGMGRGISTKEFVEAARQATRKSIPVCLEQRKLSHQPPKLFASPEKLMNKTNWSPSYLSIKNILSTAWNYAISADLASEDQDAACRTLCKTCATKHASEVFEYTQGE